MASRGRGAGRGRSTSRGALLEQLGVQRGELPPERQEAPPETYPPLQFRPLPVPEKKSIQQSYLLVLKKDLREYLQNSEYYIQLDAERPDIERYSDRYHQMLNNKKNILSLCWSRFPKELHPKKSQENKGKRKRKAAPTILRAKKRSKDINVSDKLDELEKKEVSPTEEEEGDEEEEQVEGAVEGEEEIDEEMDEGTDYINSYFDNGEDYILDDDDALEEGGVL